MSYSILPMTHMETNSVFFINFQRNLAIVCKSRSRLMLESPKTKCKIRKKLDADVKR